MSINTDEGGDTHRDNSSTEVHFNNATSPVGSVSITDIDGNPIDIQALNILSEHIDIISVTGSLDKLWFQRAASRYRQVKIHDVKQLLGTVEESTEPETDYRHIVEGKHRVSCQKWYEMDAHEQESALENAKITNVRRSVFVAEDRGSDTVLTVDGEVRPDLVEALKALPVWDQYRELDLIDECFVTGHAFPGHRFKELASAVGGTVHLIDMIKDGVRTLQRMHNVKIDVTHDSHVTYGFWPLDPDNSELPIPESGIFFHAKEGNLYFRPITDKDREREAQGAVLDFDNFDISSLYPDETIRELRDMSGHAYHERQSTTAIVLAAFYKMIGAKLRVTPVVTECFRLDNARLITPENLSPVAEQKTLHELWDRDTKPNDLNGFSSSDALSHLTSLPEFEQLFRNGEAVIIPSYDILMEKAGSDPLDRLLVKLMAQYLATHAYLLKSLHHKAMAGRPILIHKQFWDQCLQFIPDGVNRRATSVQPEHMVEFWERPSDIEDILNYGWDPDAFRADLQLLPDPMLLTNDMMLGDMHMQDTGFCVGTTGSASSHNPDAPLASGAFTYHAAQHGFFITNGGGSHMVMGASTEAIARAYNDGYRHGAYLSRVALASDKEGPVDEIAHSHGLSFDTIHGDERGKPVLQVMGENIFVRTYAEFGERQHGILGPADFVASFLGGIGTNDEDLSVLLNNALLLRRGVGLFPGFENSLSYKTLCKVDTLAEGRSTSAALVNSFTREEQEWLNLFPVSSWEVALGMAQRASEGHEIAKKPSVSHGGAFIPR